MSRFLTTVIGFFSPIFLILSPLTSYTDQILSIHRTKTSAGFSLDIPLIMLSASILKIFYWPSARYDLSLLVQALVMVGVQCVLLKVALDNRPGWRGIQRSLDSGLWRAREKRGMDGGSWATGNQEGRLWGFWRWKRERPYWEFLSLFTISLFTSALILSLTTSPTVQSRYAIFLGSLGLAIEAILPLPQLYSNYSSQSCKGFRVSVIANWLFGDAMKMGYFFTSHPQAVPWAFKACGIFQACCDVGLGLQFWIYDGPLENDAGGKEVRSA